MARRTTPGRARKLIFETHATSTDNEAGIGSGWRNPPLSALGRNQAMELGRRRTGVRFVFASDLLRCSETAQIAFAGSDAAVQLDHRLRECNYGTLNGSPVESIENVRLRHVKAPFPAGESYQDVVARVSGFLGSLPNGGAQPVLIVGHRATKYALDHLLGRHDLAEVIAGPFVWQPGWEYLLDD
jgi:broad specificity phosphatase PhoE